MILLRWRRDLNPCTRLCRPLPRLSATPPRWDAFGGLRADDGIRTRDPHLGKVMRYQLRYVRTSPRQLGATEENSSRVRCPVPNRIPARRAYEVRDASQPVGASVRPA